MIQHRHIDLICIGAVLLAVVLAIALMCGGSLGLTRASANPGYESRLFDGSRVHTIDLQVEDWGAFVRNAASEEYVPCTVEIDGERFSQVGLRAKGNNSLRLTEKYELSRHSLKLEFDEFVGGGSYHGLDKFSLDASFQDNSYLKTSLAFDMMAFMGVPTPLCSYAWVTVNGEAWGLFLAVEEPEESFAERCFGRNHGMLYKPDYRSLEDENADVALRYIDDEPSSYPGIFENAKFITSRADEKRLIGALKTLSTGENLDSAVNVDEVLRYFAVHVFVMNWDSYLGRTGHNYHLYEDGGVLSMIPWDYNLAFGTYSLGMTDPIKDPNVIVNYPVHTPAEGEVMLKRPLYHQLMKNREYFERYRSCLDEFLAGYVESGRCELMIRETQRMIAPYVQDDPTAFCTFEEHRLAVDTLEQLCRLRAQSVRGQLEGRIPATLRERQENPHTGVDASAVQLPLLGNFDNLESAKEKQDAALARVCAAGTDA